MLAQDKDGWVKAAIGKSDMLGIALISPAMEVATFYTQCSQLRAGWATRAHQVCGTHVHKYCRRSEALIRSVCGPK